MVPLVYFKIVGPKVFMDARRLVTPKEGDRYSLGPPSFVAVVVTGLDRFVFAD